MDISSNSKVNDFLIDIQSVSPAQFNIIVLIRDLFVNANNKLIEDIKYGGLVFNLSNTLVAGVFPYKGHISVEFSNGVDFDDADSLLEGSGKKRCHLKIYSKEDIVAKNCQYFVEQAVDR